MRQLFDTAVSLHRQGQLTQAESFYRQILRQLPHQSDTLNALGMLLVQQGKSKEAIQTFRKALQTDGKAAHIHLNLGEAFRASGNYKDAATSIKRALQIQPKYPEAQFCLASLLHDQGQLEDAISCYRKVLDAMPEFAPAHNSLGVALQESGNLNDAITSLLSAIRWQPDYADAHFNIANTYVKLEQESLAISHYKHCLLLAPDNHLAHCRLAEASMDQVTVTDIEIEEHLAIAAQTLSESPIFLNTLGKLRIRQGKMDAALDLLKQSIETEAQPSAIFDYTQAKKFTAKEPWLIESAQQLLSSDAVLDIEGRGLVHFSLGKMLDDIGCYDDAFEHFQQANAAILQAKSYDRPHEEYLASQLRHLFTAQFIHEHQCASLDARQLVFIVGMPRSGTTLTEQIISSHPGVFGCGELPGIDGIKAELIKKNNPSSLAFPDLLTTLPEEYLQEIAEAYLAAINQLFPGNHARLVDKLPHNFLNIGLIALLFPNAAIINVKRDPMDNCLSIYFQKFLRGHPYAYNLLDIGHQYSLYSNLMIHWHSVLPARILDIQYENLIADPEYWSRKLIEHIGLEWDDACLAPQQLARTVKTASHWQVRQPIYKTSVQRWRNYEKYLGPLKAILNY